jgi:undecaprenyl diphosphate synthase
MMRSPHTAPAACQGIHVGIIMDGNGRWAVARGLPRSAGHSAGVRAARKIVESAVRAGVGTVTLYAFSADNWSRPSRTVCA